MLIEQWLDNNIPDVRDKTFIVTGATSGLGYYTTQFLASKGAQVIMACRNLQKAEDKRKDIALNIGDAKLNTMALDLADLRSVHDFAGQFKQQYSRLDGLVNNAGVMGIPLARTKDNFEMQIGTNLFGHFALTGHLLPLIEATDNARVVNLSSVGHLVGGINLQDINRHRYYNKWLTYGQSKFAVHLFSNALASRFKQRNINALSVTAHPGFSATNLQAYGAQIQGAKMMESIIERANALFAQPGEVGALSVVHAAVGKEVVNGDYCGPDGLMGIHGFPRRGAYAQKSTRDMALGDQLWRLCEEQTGVRFLS